MGQRTSISTAKINQALTMQEPQRITSPNNTIVASQRRIPSSFQPKLPLTCFLAERDAFQNSIDLIELLFELMDAWVDSRNSIKEHERRRRQDVFDWSSFEDPGSVNVGCMKEGTAGRGLGSAAVGRRVGEEEATMLGGFC